MREWLESLDPRERILVLVAAAALVVFLVYLLVLQPFHTGYRELKDEVAAKREAVQWMRQAAQQVRQLRQDAVTPNQGLAGRSLLSVTDSSARAAGLGSAMKRVEPEGSDGVRVWLDGASFDEMIAWLGNLSTRNGIDVSSINLEKQDTPGRVNARLTLQASRL